MSLFERGPRKKTSEGVTSLALSEFPQFNLGSGVLREGITVTVVFKKKGHEPVTGIVQHLMKWFDKNPGERNRKCTDFSFFIPNQERAQDHTHPGTGFHIYGSEVTSITLR